MDTTDTEEGLSEISLSFHVKSGSYEGPLELLLDLIEKRKLLVNELSLSQVTDDYIAHIRLNDTFPVEDAANFIGIAATLLLIKSKSLLPTLELRDDEEEDVHDLSHRLKLYEKARSASRELSRIFGVRSMASRGDKKEGPFFSPSRDLELEKLAHALSELLKNKEVIEKLPEVRIRTLVSIEDMMDTLRERVERAMTLSFKDFTGTKTEKVEVIVSFLALLELVKQGSVKVSQYGDFNDIQITSSGTGVPRY